jgi:putative DNA primase/helicase
MQERINRIRRQQDFYLTAGKRIIPLRGKAPITEDYPNLPVEKCNTHINGNFGWALDAHDLIIDIDPRNGGEKGIENMSRDAGVDLYAQTPVRLITGNGGTHLVFRKDPDTRVLYKSSKYPGIEVLSYGRQVVGAGSIHPDTGREYIWDWEFETLSGIPAAPAGLLDALKPVDYDVSKDALDTYDDSPITVARFQEYLIQLGPCLATDDVSSYQVALRARDLGISPKNTLKCMMEWNEKNDPPWSEDTLKFKIRNAYRYGKSGLGNSNAAAVFDEIEGGPSETLAVAPDKAIVSNAEYTPKAPQNSRMFLEECYPEKGLRYRHGIYYGFDGEVWHPLETGELAHRVQIEMEYSNVSQSAINSTITAIERKVFGNKFTFDTTKLAFENGILDLKDPENITMEDFDISHQVTGKYPFEYDETATCPQWKYFLKEVFEVDQERIDLLQEWVGYSLIHDNRFQKIMVMVGVSRSGKGTIARVIKEVVGSDNYSGLSLSSLVDNFGCSMLLGKKIAVIADAHRPPKGTAERAKELLLNISGGDTIAVNRKYLEMISVQLGTRLTLVANEVPQFSDGADALINRFLVLPFRRTFAGEEDFQLESRLIEEVPGILVWAIEGLQRLMSNQKFTTVQAAKEEIEEIRASNNPIGDFIGGNVSVEEGKRTLVTEVYHAYVDYCREYGRQVCSAHRFSMTFIKILARHSITRERFRDAQGRQYYFTNIVLREPHPFTVIEGGEVDIFA